MSPVARVSVAVALASLTSACQQTRTGGGPLAGAWQAVQFSFTSPDTTGAVTDPQPSLYLFTSRHYSIMFVLGPEPRALFQDVSESTDAEKIAAYSSFIANSGTYTLSDSIIETRPVVAKVPNFAGQEQSYVYRLRGDSLWLTTRPVLIPAAEVRVTLVRVE